MHCSPLKNPKYQRQCIMLPISSRVENGRSTLTGPSRFLLNSTIRGCTLAHLIQPHKSWTQCATLMTILVARNLFRTGVHQKIQLAAELKPVMGPLLTLVDTLTTTTSRRKDFIRGTLACASAQSHQCGNNSSRMCTTIYTMQ